MDNIRVKIVFNRDKPNKDRIKTEETSNKDKIRKGVGPSHGGVWDYEGLKKYHLKNFQMKAIGKVREGGRE